MAFNTSFNFSYLVQTGTYNYNGENSPVAQLATTHISGNIRTTLFPRWYKQITIEWGIPPDWGNCLFNVYFCQTESGPWTKLNSTPIDGNFLKDIETQEYSKFDRGYYVVEAILLDRGRVAIRSLPATWETYQNRWVEIRSTEIQRREYLLLNKFAGIHSHVFRRKNYGERCPECWNYESEKSIKDHCKTCIGTTFKGGYFPAAPAFVQYEATPNNIAKTYFGKFEPNQIGAWTIAFPEIRADDIIVRTGDWNIYKVDQITNTELQGRTVRQIFKLTQLSKNDIEYELVTKSLPDFPSKYL